MGIKKETLQRIFEQEGYAPEINVCQKMEPSKVLKAGILEPVLEVYHELGGINDAVPFDFPPYDFLIDDKFLILDEELHFNRYRNITLRSGLYESLPLIKVDNYKRYGRQFEKECLKSGMRSGLWTNPKAEKFFGKSADAGDFFRNGSSEWKLRAFYDFLQDANALISKKEIIRISIYDNLMVEGKLMRLDKILANSIQHEKYLVNFVNRLLQMKVDNG